MEREFFDGYEFIKLHTREEYEAWVLDQWPTLADFETETGFSFAQVHYRWIRLTVSPRGRRYIHRRGPNIVPVL